MTRTLLTICVYFSCGPTLLAVAINCGWNRMEKLVERIVNMIMEE